MILSVSVCGCRWLEAKVQGKKPDTYPWHSPSFGPVDQRLKLAEATDAKALIGEISVDKTSFSQLEVLPRDAAALRDGFVVT